MAIYGKETLKGHISTLSYNTTPRPLWLRTSVSVYPLSPFESETEIVGEIVRVRK